MLTFARALLYPPAIPLGRRSSAYGADLAARVRSAAFERTVLFALMAVFLVAAVVIVLHGLSLATAFTWAGPAG